MSPEDVNELTDTVFVIMPDESTNANSFTLVIILNSAICPADNTDMLQVTIPESSIHSSPGAKPLTTDTELKPAAFGRVSVTTMFVASDVPVFSIWMLYVS